MLVKEETEVAIIRPKGVAPVNIFGTPLPRGRSKTALELLNKACDENKKMIKFVKVVERHGPDTVTLTTGFEEEDSRILALHHLHQTVFFTGVLLEMKARVTEADYILLSKMNGNGLWTDKDILSENLAAKLRHEYAHELWNNMNYDKIYEFAKYIPTDANKIRRGVTDYAADHFAHYYREPQFFNDKKIQPWPVVETWCELFAMSTSNSFLDYDFPKWVMKAIKQQDKLIGIHQ